MSSISQAGQAVKVFTTAVEQAKSDGKVKTSELSKLLKGVNNCTERLSSQDIKKIGVAKKELQSILNGQGSKVLSKKTASINNAFDQMLKNSLKSIKSSVDNLVSKFQEPNSAFHPKPKDVEKVSNQLNNFASSIKESGLSDSKKSDFYSVIKSLRQSIENVNGKIDELNFKEETGEQLRNSKIESDKARTERGKSNPDYYGVK